MFISFKEEADSWIHFLNFYFQHHSKNSYFVKKTTRIQKRKCIYCTVEISFMLDWMYAIDTHLWICTVKILCTYFCKYSDNALVYFKHFRKRKCISLSISGLCIMHKEMQLSSDQSIKFAKKYINIWTEAWKRTI